MLVGADADTEDLILDCCSLPGGAATEGLVLSAGGDSTGLSFCLAEIAYNAHVSIQFFFPFYIFLFNGWQLAKMKKSIPDM